MGFGLLPQARDLQGRDGRSEDRRGRGEISRCLSCFDLRSASFGPGGALTVNWRGLPSKVEKTGDIDGPQLAVVAKAIWTAHRAPFHVSQRPRMPNPTAGKESRGTTVITVAEYTGMSGVFEARRAGVIPTLHAFRPEASSEIDRHRVVSRKVAWSQYPPSPATPEHSSNSQDERHSDDEQTERCQRRGAATGDRAGNAAASLSPVRPDGPGSACANDGRGLIPLNLRGLERLGLSPELRARTSA